MKNENSKVMRNIVTAKNGTCSGAASRESTVHRWHSERRKFTHVLGPERDGGKMIEIRLTCGQYFGPKTSYQKVQQSKQRHTSVGLFLLLFFQRGVLHLKTPSIIESEM